MRALVQRVSEARVEVEERSIGAIGPGLLVFFCAERGDGAAEVAWLARKIARLRIFADAAGRMNHALLDVGGAVLVISQFTLAADLKKGNRPGFDRAAAPEIAEGLYRDFCRSLETLGVAVARGCFGRHMDVHLVNDGPVTIWLESGGLRPDA